MAKMSIPKHFLDLDQLDTVTLRSILDGGLAFKQGRGDMEPLKGKTLILIFEKSSTRTRVSFDVGMQQLGGRVVVLDGNSCQMGRGESIADTARVLSRYADAIMIRTDDPVKLLELAEYSTIPVINGLTDDSHPCQLMADVMTFEEHAGPIAGRSVVWCGDGNNMATSWIQAAVRFDFSLRLACPKLLMPNSKILDWARAEGGDITVTNDVKTAVTGADCVIADTWVSMGDDDAESRHDLLASYRVDQQLMDLAGPEALFMHCLPAHRGEEVTAEVIDGPRSVVWDEAENRLHAQKGILAWCMENN
jgi:ornithine carbamoyltransferase